MIFCFLGVQRIYIFHPKASFSGGIKILNKLHKRSIFVFLFHFHKNRLRFFCLSSWRIFRNRICILNSRVGEGEAKSDPFGLTLVKYPIIIFNLKLYWNYECMIEITLILFFEFSPLDLFPKVRKWVQRTKFKPSAVLAVPHGVICSCLFLMRKIPLQEIYSGGEISP